MVMHSCAPCRAAAAMGLCLALVGTALLGIPAPALAQDEEELSECTGGTTRVTVETDDENLAFRVPTVIPFVALASGELVGPSAESTLITNLSVFRIHVVGASVEFDECWTAVSDAAASTAENAIDFQFGPEGALTDAADATDDDVSACTEYNMGYAGSESASICIETAGTMASVTENLVSGEAERVATITWTVSAGVA